MSKIIFHADDFGRSPNISKSIYKSIIQSKISSISIIVSDKIYGLSLLKKVKVSKRLHLNLTDFTYKKSKEDNIYNLSFFKLFIMPLLPNFEENKKNIKKEILRQIKLYKKYVKKELIFLDSHQHVHMIPWIFNIIFDLRKKNKIINIRIPNEKFLINYFDLLNINIIKNIIKYFTLKFFILISKKKINKIGYKYNFFGIIYSGIQNKKYLKKIFNFIKNDKSNKITEILFHPGYAIKTEKDLFKDDFFKYYISNKRKNEFILTRSFLSK